MPIFSRREIEAVLKKFLKLLDEEAKRHRSGKAPSNAASAAAARDSESRRPTSEKRVTAIADVSETLKARDHTSCDEPKIAGEPGRAIRSIASAAKARRLAQRERSRRNTTELRL